MSTAKVLLPTLSGVKRARSTALAAIFALVSPMRSSVPSGQVAHEIWSTSVPLGSTRASARSGAGLRQSSANAAAPAARMSPPSKAMSADPYDRGLGGGLELGRA